MEFIALTNCAKISLPQKQSPKSFYKKAAPESFAIVTGKHPCWSLFSIKLNACQIFKSTFFTEHLRMTASLCSYLQGTFFFLINFFIAGLTVICFTKTNRLKERALLFIEDGCNDVITNRAINKEKLDELLWIHRGWIVLFLLF